MADQMKNIDKVGWIYIQNRKLLGAKSFNKTPFYVPGGKREGNETDQETLVRELKEELNINIKPETAEFVGEFSAQAHGKPEGVLVVLRAYTAGFDGEIEPSAEIEAIGWHTSKDIGTEKTSPVDNIILKYLKDQNLID
jgi:8-oxo-dGTP diphosphatase